MMLRLRSALFVFLMTVTVIPYGIFCTLIAPLPLSLRYRITIAWPRFALWLARLICGVRREVRGAEIITALDQAGARVILASKHQSIWETFALLDITRRQVCYVFKRAILKIPFFGWGIGLLKMIHIDRRRGSQAFNQVVEQGQERLAEGRWIIMFPEGTRTPVGARPNYNSGAARLAVRTGAIVVPIALNSGEHWPRRRFVLTPGLITISIGPPIDSTGLTAEQLNTAIETWIENEMRVLSPLAYRQPGTA
ncbi:lysophospholipid acyltransferase family protein [soil metagenome]